MPDRPALTLDVDWAPDAMVREVAALLVERGVRATWFVTHAGPALDALRAHPELFELGVHPNLLPGSSHGATPEAVLDHVLALVPGARCVRTHCLVQSTPWFELLARRGTPAIDASLHLPRTGGVAPVTLWTAGGAITRIAHVWEDDLEMARPDPDWDLSATLDGSGGLKVFDFHPVHVWLNSASFAPYAALKAAGWHEPERFRAAGDAPGARSAFLTLADRLAAAGGGPTLSELAA